MGNWFGRSKLMMKPLENVGGMMRSQEDRDKRRKSFDEPSSALRIKVRMTKRQLQELKARADTSQGNSELGRLIIKECLEGRLSPCVAVRQGRVLDNSRSRRFSLSTIDEESREL